MHACNDMGRVAVVTDDRDEFGEDYQTIRVMTVVDAVNLRDQLTEVIEQVTAKPSNAELSRPVERSGTGSA